MRNRHVYNNLVAIKRKEIMLEQRGTSLIQEGVFIEASKVFLQDAIKNLLATGAVVITGGLPADTVVEVIYAIERTKKAIEMYNNIMDAKDASQDIMVNFMHAMDTANLEGNLDELVEIGKKAILDLSRQGDKVLGKGESAEMVGDLKDTIDEFRGEFLEFFKVKLAALADWVSTLIPDDGGNVSSFIKITVFTIIEDMSQRPLQTFTELVNKLPGEGPQIVFDEVKLESFLIDICNQVADGIEGMKGGNVETAISMMGKGTELGSKMFPGMQAQNKMLGVGAQSVADVFMGDESVTGKASRAFFDPVYRMDSAKELFEKTVNELPVYIRTEIIPMIPETVDMYAKFMKYMIAFLGLLESTMDGSLETDIRNYNNQPTLPDMQISDTQLVAEVRRSLRKQLRRRRLR